jgi:cellulose biosynthesis protein BcsQ
MLLAPDRIVPDRGALSRASKLVSNSLSADDLCNAPSARDSDQIQAVSAFYDLAKIETRLFMQWLVEEFKKDLRYVLRDLLLSEQVQRRFDVVIIDCPPRLTTAAMQAFCASTHLLVPTKLDNLSGSAVGTFVNQILEFRELWPTLRLIGSAGVMVAEDPANGNDPSLAERQGEASVNVTVREAYDARHLPTPAQFMLPRDTYIAEKTEIARHAGNDIVYLNLRHSQAHESLRAMIRRLGAVVEGKLYEGA